MPPALSASSLMLTMIPRPIPPALLMGITWGFFQPFSSTPSSASPPCRLEFPPSPTFHSNISLSHRAYSFVFQVGNLVPSHGQRTPLASSSAQRSGNQSQDLEPQILCMLRVNVRSCHWPYPSSIFSFHSRISDTNYNWGRETHMTDPGGG